jgi:hypothetical protein
MKRTNCSSSKVEAITSHAHKMCLPAVLALILIGSQSAEAFLGEDGLGGVNGNANAAYEIGLWGDLPYSVVQAEVGVPNLIADMNSQALAFTVHDGDLKQGSNSPCDDALYLRSLGYFSSLSAPAIFTPGDNDWSDCDRSSNGGFYSLERLSHERQVFFNSPYTPRRGTGPITFSQQQTVIPSSIVVGG